VVSFFSFGTAVFVRSYQTDWIGYCCNVKTVPTVQFAVINNANINRLTNLNFPAKMSCMFSSCS